jgi:hypothetical protein
VEQKAKCTIVAFNDYDDDEGVVSDPNANPSYADSLLNLLQNIPSFIILIVNMKLMGDSFIGVFGLFTQMLVAVTAC